MSLGKALFAAHASKKWSSGRGKGWLKEAFSGADANGDGELSLGEFKAAGLGAARRSEGKTSQKMLSSRGATRSAACAARGRRLTVTPSWVRRPILI